MNDLVAEALADCLERLEAGKCSLEECLQRYPEFRSELAPMLQLVKQLKSTEQISPRSSLRADSRERLIAQLQPRRVGVRAHRLNVPLKKTLSQTGNLRRIAAFGIMTILLLVLIGTGTVYASNQALPGDLLYPVKLDVEKVQLSVFPQESQVDLGIQFMHKRNEEINRLIELERYKDLDPALQNLEHLSGDAVQQYGILDNQQHPDANQQGNSLDNAIENNITVLNRVLTQVPPQARDAIGHAIEKSKKDSSSVEEKLNGRGRKNGENSAPSIQQQNPSSTPDPSGTKANPRNQPTTSPGKPESTHASGPGNNSGGSNGKPPEPNSHSKP